MADSFDPPDERLVSLSKDGSLDAFNSLVERHQTAVYNLCLRLLGQPQAAEDAAQEAFLSAFRALPRFAGGNFRSWLLRIAANESKDELRRRRRKDASASLSQIYDNSELPLEPADDVAGTELLYERKEAAAAIQTALLELPFDQRLAVTLCDLHGLPYEAVATATGASLGTVKSRIHRGRIRLREVIMTNPELFGVARRLDGGER
ncbi:MAG TPA: sigma-70 family RNA polymerase sigma factor [Tepidiformaceae bacterium]|nr:sigma-70 family RNA polymerase sigma factor [Tepidiformaceae bacterium]